MNNRIFQRLLLETRNQRNRNSYESENSNSDDTDQNNLKIVEIKENEFEEKKNEITINPWNTNNFIIDFLIKNGMQEAALEFIKEAGIENICADSLKTDKLKIMSKIRKSILLNEVENSIEILDQFNPNILKNNKDILFELLSIKLMELLEKFNITEVIEFIKKEMLPIFKDSENFISKIENFMGEIMINIENIKNINIKRKSKEELILIINNAIHDYYNDVNYSKLEVLTLLNEFYEKKMENYYKFKHYKYD